MVNLDELVRKINTIINGSGFSSIQGENSRESVSIPQLRRVFDAMCETNPDSICTNDAMREQAKKFREIYQKLTRALNKRELSYTEINQHFTRLEESFSAFLEVSKYGEAGTPLCKDCSERLATLLVSVSPRYGIRLVKRDEVATLVYFYCLWCFTDEVL